MKKIFVSFLSFYLLLNFCEVFAVFAQGAEYLRPRSSSSEATQDPDSRQEKPLKDYFINAGDVIQVFVWQNPDLSKDVIVAPDGKISYPFVGTIQASGLTIDQLEAKITQGIALYVKDPNVSLMIREVASEVKQRKEKEKAQEIVHKITVLGAVNSPGTFTYTGTINLIDAIVRAGYFNDKAREDIVRIVRDNEIREIRLNWAEALRKGDSKIDTINLKPDDIVFVLGMVHKITVLGEVNSPGTFTYTGTMSLIDAIAKAGYFNDKASKDSVRIIRGNEVREVRLNLAEALRKGDSKIDTINLKPDDIVFVPGMVHKIIILGEVNSPGAYTYTGKMNLIDAIAKAGYFNDKAREDCVMIIRRNALPKPTVIRVNLAEVIRKGDIKIDISLKPNDIVFVPKSFIADFNKFLNNINPTLSTIQTIEGISQPRRDYGTGI
jgi:protein involved in polysaccharide export with SLBB domain